MDHAKYIIAKQRTELQSTPDRCRKGGCKGIISELIEGRDWSTAYGHGKQAKRRQASTEMAEQLAQKDLEISILKERIND